jgi:hypothetical protein
MKRPDFLTMFFIALGVVFVAVVAVRIRSYQIEDELMLGSERTATSAGALDAIDSPRPPTEEAPLPAGDAPPAGTKRPAAPDYGEIPLLEPSARIPVARPTATAAPPIALDPAPPPAAAVAAPAATKAAAAPPRSVNVQPRAQQPTQQSSQQPTQQSSSNKPPEPSTEPKDTTSDSTPPQLASIIFAPPQVADGEETMLVVEAMDDLSGVRSISGTITAPSGAVQGFACQREGDTNRYVARVMVPKDAAEGVWSVSYLNLMDNASNAAALTVARGALPATASFRVVSSRPDSQGPSLEAVWLDRRSMRGGEKNIVFVRANDDKAGVNLVSGIFQNPSRVARVGFVCRTTGDGLWTCELNAPACADCGEWQLEQVQMQDKANNMTTLRAAQSAVVAAVRLDIASEACDSTPPALQSISLDKQVVSNIEQSTINVTVSLTDDACGVLSVSGQATGPQSTTGTPPRLYFSFSPSNDPATWTARLVVPRLAAKGAWRVSFLQVLDRGQNLKTYTQNDPLLAGITFMVD